MEYEVVRYKKRERKKRKISKLTGQRIYSRSELEKGLWSVFSLYVRLRDEDCVLIGWGNHLCSGAIQAGHVISRRCTATKYDETNVFAQCQKANYVHQYHPEIYLGWYASTYGADTLNELVLKSQEPAKKLSPKELINLTTEYAKRIEELKA